MAYTPRRVGERTDEVKERGGDMSQSLLEGLDMVQAGINSDAAEAAVDEMDAMARRNDLRDQMFSFLARGGGTDLANKYSKGTLQNILAAVRGNQGFINPEVMKAREGLGPGGGLGVYRNAKDYMDENVPEYEAYDSGNGLMGGILGAAGTIAGGAFGGPIGAKIGGMAGGVLGKKL